MNATKLNSSAGTATIGGGAMQYEIVRALFKHGKQTGSSIATYQDLLPHVLK
jgi:hypothetical protein